MAGSGSESREYLDRPADLEAGADLYKTRDGVTWYPVTLDGFGDVGNYGFRTMISTGDAIFIGTANPFDGLEVWRRRSRD